MSYTLPHLHNGWQVDQAILSGEDRVVVIHFGHDWDPTCMKMDEVLYSIAEKVTRPRRASARKLWSLVCRACWVAAGLELGTACGSSSSCRLQRRSRVQGPDPMRGGSRPQGLGSSRVRAPGPVPRGYGPLMGAGFEGVHGATCMELGTAHLGTWWNAIVAG